MLILLILSLNLFATDLTWKRLLHFENGKSLADGPRFFLAPSGKTDAQAEYEATYSALKEKPETACDFPARFKYFQKIDPTLKRAECKEFDDWLRGINATSATLIFASSYPNNPASLFGHTFLRLNQSDKKSDLTDYIVNYAATTGDDGGIPFAVFGVFGGYEGHFSIAPYFIKVKEYNHIEGRDLFEYDLKLTPDEIDTLLRHLFELEKNTYFNYFFFDENCSYMLLRLIDVVRPSLNLSSKFKYWAIPWETVQVLEDAKLIGASSERASLITRIKERHGTKTIDDELDYLFYLKNKKEKLAPEDEKRERELLTTRSKLPRAKEQPTRREISEERSPLLVHKVSKIDLGIKKREHRIDETLSYRLGVHHALDPYQGTLPYTNLELFKFDLYRDQKIKLERFTLIDILSHSEFEPNDFTPSYKLKATYLESKEKEFVVGIGTTPLHTLNFTYAIFINSESRIYKHLLSSLSPELQIYKQMQKKILGSFSSSYHFHPRRFESELKMAYFFRSFTINSSLGLNKRASVDFEYRSTLTIGHLF